MNRPVWMLLGAAAVLLGRGASAGPDDAADFDRDIRPIFESRCLSCHGREKRKGGLLLTDRRSAMALGDSGTRAVVPGRPEKSELFRKITAADPDDRMPPKGDPLTKDQIALFKKWIEAGAAWSREKRARHWAYVKPVRPEAPDVRDAAWGRNPIDRFVLARLEAAGLKPSPPADPARLIRRVSLDLTGLPPSVKAVDAFVEDGSDRAYGKVVDDLLASKRFGEHWARPWLDLARYADSNGFQADQLRESWAFRDWVIDAMNAGMPFDQFTIEQIAGDLLPGSTPAQRVATGFHRTVTCNVEAGVDPEENRTNQVIDRVNTTGTVWLGSTIECAQCHNHKYDPFTQEDYYRLFAYFNNTPMEVKQAAGVRYDFVGPTMTVPLPATRKERWSRLQARRAELESRRKELAARDTERREAWMERMWKAVRENPPRWQVLEMRSFRSTGAEDYRKLEDGSILIGGRIPGSTSYTLKSSTRLTGITAFRLQTLTHPELPGNGPGRGDDLRPNFVLNEFSVTARGRRIRLHTARADFSQKRWAVHGAVDGNPKTGWAIAPQFGKPHRATFRTSRPLGDGEDLPLTFTLDQSYGRGRTIGRLRISALVGDPEVLELPEDVLAIFKKENASKREAQRLEKYYQVLNPDLKKLDEQIGAVKRDIEKIKPPTTLVMVEMAKPRMTSIFMRGDFLNKGAKVEPGVPEVLPALPAAAPGNRLGLARWLIDGENPLVGRVTVNRWWAELFGRGLVKTAEDFGTQGDPPTHPKLLDWLAVEFVDSGWSMKHMLKLIVMSSTYRQTSRMTPDLLEKDPQNMLFARGPRFRLSAEAIRDNALAISGLLSTKMSGSPVMPFQPRGLWRQVGRNEPKWLESPGEDRYRRGIYVVWRRAAPYPSFVTFDAPDRAACVVQRSRTNTPLQALTLLNDPAYIEMAFALAGRMMTNRPDATDAERAAYGFRLCVARRPSSRESGILMATYRRELESFRSRPGTAKQLIDDIRRWKPPAGVDPDRLAAWFAVANLLLNLDETITKG